MTKRKTTLKFPDAYLPLLEDLRLLKRDENNPNRMNTKQKDHVWSSLQKYGWTCPIITNKDGVFADVDRRMLRQILNKLKDKRARSAEHCSHGKEDVEINQGLLKSANGEWLTVSLEYVPK